MSSSSDRLSIVSTSSGGGSSSTSATSGVQGGEGGASQITVCVRVRPLTERERAKNQSPVWHMEENSIAQCNAFGRPLPGSTYSFDHVFNPEVPSEVIYDIMAKDILRGCIDGFNGTIFAYGQTSSGKTYTMHGCSDCPGIIPLGIQDIFRMISETPGREYLLRVSYLEIYNEIMKDLLCDDGENLKIHEDVERGVFVGDLREEVVMCAEQVLELLQQGEERRHVGQTNMNERSSRSHTIFRMVIESRTTGDMDGAVRVSTLNLVDLAGSERISLTGAEGVRLREGAMINKSLLTLGTVISKLSEGNRHHIPYRDSKLTRYLSTALGGNSRTAIICAVTPAAMHSEETHTTLKFASRAKKIKNRVQMNEIIDDKTLLKRYQKEITELKSRLDESSIIDAVEKAEAAEARIREIEGERVQAVLDRQQLESRIQNLEKFLLHPSLIDDSEDGGDGMKSVKLRRKKRPTRRYTVEGIRSVNVDLIGPFSPYRKMNDTSEEREEVLESLRQSAILFDELLPNHIDAESVRYLEEQRDMLLCEKEELETCLEESKMQVDSSLREIVSLREQLDLKTSSADDMRGQLDRLAESLAEKDVEVELLQDQLRLTDTEKVRLDEEKQKLLLDMQRLQEESNDYSSYQELEEEAKELREFIQDLEASLKEMAMENENLLNRVSSLQLELKESEDQNNRSTSLIEELDVAMNEAMEEVQRLRREASVHLDPVPVKFEVHFLALANLQADHINVASQTDVEPLASRLPEVDPIQVVVQVQANSQPDQVDVASQTDADQPVTSLHEVDPIQVFVQVQASSPKRAVSNVSSWTSPMMSCNATTVVECLPDGSQDDVQKEILDASHDSDGLSSRDYEAEIHRLREELEEFEDKVAVQANDIESLEIEREDLLRELEETKAYYLNEIDRLQEIIDSLETEKDQVQEPNTTVSIELANARLQCSKMENEVTRLSSLLEASEENSNLLRVSVDEKTKMMESLQLQISDLEAKAFSATLQCSSNREHDLDRELREARDEMRALSAKLESEKEFLERMLANARTENEKLQGDLAIAQDDLFKRSAERDILLREQKTLTDRITLLSQESGVKSSSYSSLEKKTMQLETSLSLSQQEKESMEIQLEDLKKQKDDLFVQLEESSKKVAELLERNVSSQSGSSNKIHALELREQELSTKLQIAQEELQQSKEQSSLLHQQLEKCEATIANLQTTQCVSSSAEQSLRDTITNLQSALEKRKLEYTTSEKERDCILGKLELMEEEKIRLEEESNSLQSDKQRLQDQITQLQKEKVRLADDASKYAQSSRMLEERCQQLSNELEQARQEAEKAESNISKETCKLRTDLEKYKEKDRESTKKIGELESAARKGRMEAGGLTKDRERLVADKEKLDKMNSALKEQIQQLKRDLADANTEIKKKDIEVRDASKDISKMKKQNEKTQDLETKTKELTSSLRDFEKECESLREQISCLRSDLNTREQDLVEKLNTISELESQVETFRNTVLDRENENISLMDKIEEIFSENEAIKKEKGLLTEKVAELETALEQTTQLLNAAEQTADEYREKITTLSHEYEEVLHSSNSAKDENELLRTQAEGALEAMNELRLRCSTLENDLNSQRESFGSLEVTYDSLTKKHQEVVQMLRSAEIEKNELAAAITDAEFHMSEMRDSLADKDIDMGSMRDQLQSEIDILNQEIENRDAEISMLKEQDDDLQLMLDGYVAELEAVKCELLDTQSKFDNLRSANEILEEQCSGLRSQLIACTDYIKSSEISHNTVKEKLHVVQSQYEHVLNRLSALEIFAPPILSSFSGVKTASISLRDEISAGLSDIHGIVGCIRDALPTLLHNIMNEHNEAEEAFDLVQQLRDENEQLLVDVENLRTLVDDPELVARLREEIDILKQQLEDVSNGEYGRLQSQNMELHEKVDRLEQSCRLHEQNEQKLRRRLTKLEQSDPGVGLQRKSEKVEEVRTPLKKFDGSQASRSTPSRAVQDKENMFTSETAPSSSEKKTESSKANNAEMLKIRNALRNRRITIASNSGTASTND